jgi:putative FmdB family regulatory protein
MPIYEYRCENGHTFEVLQSMSDDPVSACEECGAPVQRVYHPVAVHYKGSGFYTTDYAGKGKSGGDSGAKSDSKSSDSSSGDSSSSDSSSSSSGDSKDSKGSKDSKATSTSSSD